MEVAVEGAVLRTPLVPEALLPVVLDENGRGLDVPLAPGLGDLSDGGGDGGGFP